MDMEISNSKEKSKPPKSVWFIILNELCERFSYFGLRTVLVLYLSTILKLNEEQSTKIYHSFMFFTYLMPFFGAILADSYLGKFKTIKQLSMVYALGNVVLTGSSMADMLSLNNQRIITILGLFFIAVGTGGIKPCVFPFGGDQFRLPEQEKGLARFTSRFLVAYSISHLVSTFLTPELRHNVHCFGKTSCFPLAFGVPAVMMFVAIGLFVAGKNMYVMKKPEHNVISRTFGCIFYALRTKLTSCSVPPVSHWLNRAKGSYDEITISETKSALNVIAVFTTYPIFSALFEQQASRWMLQATLMNGRIDYLGWTLKPDQMMTVHPFFGLMFILLFDIIINPFLAMIGVRKPLQKIALSGLLATIAFIFAALLQLKIVGNTTVIPSGKGSLNIYNGFECDVAFSSSLLHTGTIDSLDMINLSHTLMTKKHIVKLSLTFSEKCSPNIPENFVFNTTVTFVEGKEVSYYLTSSYLNSISLYKVGNYDYLVKDKFGNPKVRILFDNTIGFDNNITLSSTEEDSSNVYSFSSFLEMDYNVVKMGKYNILFNEQPLPLKSIDLKPATFYTLTVQQNGDKTNVKLFSMDEGNYVHIFWQLPQHLTMIMADVIFVITTTKFTFTEAPMNLKSFISAMSLLTTSFGNLLVVLITYISIKNQAYEFILYAGLMFADTLLLAYFSVVYRSYNGEM